tara:strand:+ start:35470 stop:35913 length:444 start_codon:yes stop_codon:yes gene_type:complete
MYKHTLKDDVIAKLETLIDREKNGGRTFTVEIMQLIKCSRSFVSKLRKNFRDNDGKIILQKEGVLIVRDLQRKAIERGDRFFAIGKNCPNCGFDKRYTSTGSCAPCCRLRNKQKLHAVAIPEKTDEVITDLPIYSNKTLIETGSLFL